ncbi:MAG TPA: DegT/DnrJ/EryC1/StrS family aminotransferase [Candidatus Binatia bacterium]|jgi:perosamine synthetase|nr:DegT/DnrJ/EryC1/StrS family aminotransferase [Candidatus Binatia bacterium]
MSTNPNPSGQNDPSQYNRRTFLKSGTVAVAGLSLGDYAFASPKAETLALAGGAKAVDCSAEQLAALTRWPRYSDVEKKAVCDLLDNNKFYEELPLFENEWQAYTKSPFVKAHINGSSALTSMYFALDLPAGSEIMVPSYTFVATCLTMRFFGCVPIFIDIDPKTATFDLEDAKRKLTPRTRALVTMHSWGMPCEMDRIATWAKEKGLILLEDAAHAHGASMQGRKMGTWGTMGIFSFQASKVLPAIEGGMGMYQTRELYERAAAFAEYNDPGRFPKESPVHAYEGTGFGQKYRMHPLAAAIARQQLKKLNGLNELVEKNVRAMNDPLTHLEGIAEPRLRSDQKRVYYNGNMLLVDFKKIGLSRDAVIKALTAEGVHARFWDYPEQHKLKIYSEAKWWHHPPEIPASMPGNDWINANHIFLPAFYVDVPELIGQYVKAFHKVWSHRTELASL